MSDRNPLILPADAEVRIGGNTLVITHPGDVFLEQTFGRRIVRLEAGGDIRLACPKITGTILGGGTVEILSNAEVEEIRGDVIVLGDVSVRARAIVATTRVVIGATALTVDVIVAPEVVIDEGATGRIRVVDALHECPPSRVRGCLSLADYETDFGNVAEFLERRGVAPINPLPVSAPETTDDSMFDDHATLDDSASFYEDPETFGRDLESVEALAETIDDSVQEAPAFVAPPPPPPFHEADEAPTAIDVEPVDVKSEGDQPVLPDTIIDWGIDSEREEVDEGDEVDEVDEAPIEIEVFDDDIAEDLPSVSVEWVDDEPSIAPPSRGPSREARQLIKSWERLQAAYASSTMPNAVTEMGGLVEEGRFDEVTEAIDVFWRQTLREHIQLGAPPPRRATLAFHGIRSVAA